MPLEIPPTLAPGVTIAQRDSKFQNWNGEYGYYQRADTRLQPYRSDNMTSMVYKKEDMRNSHGICHTMRLANRASVVRPEGPGSAEPVRPISLKRSVNHDCYVDFKGLTRKGISAATSGVDEAANFQGAFENIATKGDYDGDDCYIRMDEVKDVLIAVLGETVPTYVTEKFMKLSKLAEVGGRVYWADFKRLAPSALLAASADCNVKKELPPLVLLMTKPRLTDPDMGPMAKINSCYSDTFGPSFAQLTKDPESVPVTSSYTKFLVKDGFVSKEPVLQPRSILNPANAELSAGTPKGLSQIPGYTGHIPRNMRNPRKAAHSRGEFLHDVVNALRMTKKGGSNVLGYAGHVPWHADSERERVSGCDPRTSTGAAFGEERLPL